MTNRPHLWRPILFCPPVFERAQPVDKPVDNAVYNLCQRCGQPCGLYVGKAVDSPWISSEYPGKTRLNAVGNLWVSSEQVVHKWQKCVDKPVDFLWKSEVCRYLSKALARKAVTRSMASARASGCVPVIGTTCVTGLVNSGRRRTGRFG